MSRLRCATLDRTGRRDSSFFVLHSSLNPATLDRTEKTIPATATPCHPERSAAKPKDLPKDTEKLSKMSRLRCAPLDMTGERNSSFFVLHSSLNPATLDKTEKTIPATATPCHPERSAAKSKDLPKATEILNKMSRLRCVPPSKTVQRNSSFFVLHSSFNRPSSRPPDERCGRSSAPSPHRA